MIGDLQRRVTELRFLEGIEKVEHVPYSTGDEFWVRFNQPLDHGKLAQIARAHNYQIIRFAGLPSKLPRKLAEILSNGISWIIAPKITGWQRFKSALGFEPEGIAKVAMDLHSGQPIFIATGEEGIKLLYEYLGVNYMPPAPPPPKPAPPAAKPIPAAVKPIAPAAQGTAPKTSAPSSPTPTPVPTAAQVKPATLPTPAQQAVPKPANSTQPKDAGEQ